MPSIDMTAMVDIGFLLLTFFILTTKFKAEEKVVVDTPSSISTVVLPATDIFMLTIAKDGRVFIGGGDQNTRGGMLDKIEKANNFRVSALGRNFFINQSSFGVPVREMSQWLNQPTTELMKEYTQRGIPIDIRRGRTNELKEWIISARRTNARLRFAVKGDRDVKYEFMEKVIYSLQDAGINKFNLVTDLEADPDAKEAQGGAGH